MLQGNKASVTEGQIIKMTKKYGTTGFMYTEYPHKRFWNQDKADQTFEKALKERFSKKAAVPAMLYVHIPYCPQLCWFCTCHMFITKEYGKIQTYLKLLYQEIKLLKKFFQEHHLEPDFREIHLGGGSPTMLTEEDFEKLTLELGALVNLKELDEFALEVDPRRVDQEKMRFYASKGINRISFGIQDFDPKVQKAINRPQEVELIQRLLTPDLRALFKNGVNFDVICGLPHQTPETMSKTCEIISALSPDRICLNYLHFSPEMAQHQKIMMDGKDGRPERLPDYSERKEIFSEALKVLTKRGYVRTGYDHFAKPTDANAQAMQEGNMAWNELGVTPGRVFDVVGLGVSSLSTIGDYYFQNFYELIDYEKFLQKKSFPVYRGYQLNSDDLIRREVIQNLRIFFSVEIPKIEKKYGIRFEEYFSKEIFQLQEFIKDGLVLMTQTKMEITEFGRQFANIICRNFDVFYDGPQLVPDLGERNDDSKPIISAWTKLKQAWEN